MAKSLLYIVGTSDVKLNGRSRFDNFYETTKRGWEIFENIPPDKIERTRHGFSLQTQETIKIENKEEPLSSIELPIFAPLLEELQQEEISQIYLFATEQNPHHHQDTLYAAYLIKHFAKLKKNVGNISIECIRENPSDYDLMADYFRNFFKNNEKQLRNNVINYISITAGTPALTANVALASMDLPVEYYYLPKGTNRPKKTELFHKLNRQKYVCVLKELIKSYEYGTASRIAENSPFGTDYNMLTLLKAMQRRILFDFSGALEESRKVDINNKVVSDLKNNLSDLALGKIEKILTELYYRVQLSFKKNDFLESIALLFSLLDNLLQYLFTKYTEVEIKKEEGHFIKFNEYIENNPELKEHLEKEKIKYKDNPSQITLIEILNWINKKEQKNDLKLQKLREFRNKCELSRNTVYGKISLLDLRNKGPYAHGSKGITEELIKELYPPYGCAGLIEDLKDCVESILDIKLDINPFKRVNELINQSLSL